MLRFRFLSAFRTQGYSDSCQLLRSFPLSVRTPIRPPPLSNLLLDLGVRSLVSPTHQNLSLRFDWTLRFPPDSRRVYRPLVFSSQVSLPLHAPDDPPMRHLGILIFQRPTVIMCPPRRSVDPPFSHPPRRIPSVLFPTFLCSPPSKYIFFHLAPFCFASALFYALPDLSRL